LPVLEGLEVGLGVFISMEMNLEIADIATKDSVGVTSLGTRIVSIEFIVIQGGDLASEGGLFEASDGWFGPEGFLVLGCSGVGGEKTCRCDGGGG
jgi:hypothetical protein